MTSITCPYCGSAATLETGPLVYPHCPAVASKPFWVCLGFPDCHTFVGCHPGTETPLGSLANGELRLWRKRAHLAFDALWKNEGPRTRGDTERARRSRGLWYAWLSCKLQIPTSKCHIGMFDVATCRRTVDACEAFMEKIVGYGTEASA
jgi:hypothetical protein